MDDKLIVFLKVIIMSQDLHSFSSLNIIRIYAVLAAFDEDTQPIGYGSSHTHVIKIKLAMYNDKF